MIASTNQRGAGGTPGSSAGFRRAVTRGATGLLGVLALYAIGCGGTPPVAELPPPPVTVSQPVVRPITDQDPYDGRIAAVEKVEVRARVKGHLTKILFKE